ncbi:EpsG family protein [Vibrio sp. Vb1554]|uniref:EpsG family protein n=1 Tax=Vibrio TaxID=662 RepID=UPI001BD23BAC|nr:MULTISPECIES: EpsG family protein [Vibrio]MBS9808718.1 EpsG family protein [Vibrio alginolyticus]MDW1822675.1 EpsG family protein [Vibrio sp. Vb1018]MDW3045638.1 EpsG family protein [Vibrio sp. Vb1554]
MHRVRNTPKLAIFSLSMIYALSLVLIFPIDGSIIDRANYLDYASNAWLIMLRYLSKGDVRVLFNEPIWLLMNMSLRVFFSPENIIRVLVFFSSFLSCYVCLKNNRKEVFLVLIILLFPQVVKNYIIHLRQGVAISVFLLAYYYKDCFFRKVLFLITPLIHVSFFFVLLVYGVVILSKKIKLTRNFRGVTISAIGIGIALSLAIISAFLGARQANEYAFVNANVSGGAFLFWSSILVLYWMQGRRYCHKYAFEISGALFYLSTYFLTEVTGRVFESFVVLVLIAGCYLTSSRKVLFRCAFILFFIFSYMGRISMPYFGWGVSS